MYSTLQEITNLHGRAFNNREYCDLVITCGNLKWDVHKVVVCIASQFFRNACNFAVGKEAEDKCIDLPEDEPGMAQRLITFFYKGDYEPTTIRHFERLMDFDYSAISEEPASIYHNIVAVTPWWTKSSGTSERPVTDNSACACIAQIWPPNLSAQANQPLTTAPLNLPKTASVLERMKSSYQVKNPLTIHASMYALADKYFVESLAIRAKEKFAGSLADHWNSEDFIAAVQIIYRSTPDEDRGLRDVVIQAFKDHFKVDVSEIPGTEEKLAHFDELSFLLMKSWSRKGC